MSSNFKRKLSAFAAMMALISFSGAALAVNSSDVINKTGNAEVKDISSTRTDINVTGGKGAVAQIDFKNFNVAKGQHVNYGFSNLSQTMINRVLGGNESRILGKITNSCINGGSCSSYATTGKVVLINPAGVMFGQGSTVDLNSFTVSTFDFNGARNLKGMSEAQIEAYQKGTLDKLSPISTVNGTNIDKGSINFDSNYTQAFTDAGIDMSKFAGKTKVALDGTKFNNFTYDSNYNITGEASKNTNKTINIVSDNVEYKDSLLKTGSNLNYSDYDKSYGNVRIVTADGVTFQYLNNGYADNGYKVADDTKTNVVRNIDINNSGFAKDQVGIQSGDVRIINKSNADGSNVKINNTLIKATKLVNGENGNVEIVGSKDVQIASSRIDTVNTNAKDNYTYNKGGGIVQVSAGKNLDVSKSVIKTAGSKDSSIESAGDVRMYAKGGNLNIKDTKVLSDGRVIAQAYDKVNTDKTLLQAKNSTQNNINKNAEISGGGGVNINDSVVNATGDVDIYSKYSNGNTAGDINITSTKVNGENQTLIYAGEGISIEGKNTTLDNASLSYINPESLKFYGDNTTGTNNVTVKNDTTFARHHKTPDHLKDIAVETNGDFTLDKATMQYAKADVEVGKDNGTASAFDFKVNVAPEDATRLTVTSTQGNINVINNTKVNVVKNPYNTPTAPDGEGLTSNIIMNAQNGDYTQKDSTLTSYNDILIENVGGKITLDNSTTEGVVGHTNLSTNGVGDKGNIEIKNNSRVESAQYVHIESNKGSNITVDNSKVIAGSDRAGWDGQETNVKDPNDVEGDVRIAAYEGSIYVKNNSDVESQDANIVLSSKNQINFGDKENDKNTNITKSSNIKAENNITVKSTAEGIQGEKTTMPTMQYGGRLAFNAKKDNVFTSKDSLKSVNVDYIAEGANRIYTTTDNQFVNSSLKAPNNFIESGKDVILNKTEIKSPTANPEDTKTQIFANGNVTTDDVTGTMEADIAKAVKVYPQSVSTDRVANPNRGELNINKTKLVVQTDTVKDAQNPDNGTISLDLRNADNPKAGVELTAQNVKALDKDSTDGYFKSGYYKSGDAQWDENIAPKEGPEVRLNANDDNISIAKIDTDKLTLDPTDKKIADNTNGTPTITVKDQGGFNLDPELKYNDDKTGDGFGYTKNYDSTITDHTPSELQFDPWSPEQQINQYTDENGNVHTIYETTRDGRVTDDITTQIDKSHQITFDNNGNPSEFKLIYEKEDTKVIPGYEIKVDDVREEIAGGPKVTPPGTTPEDFIKTRDDVCEKPEDNDPIFADSFIDQITLPREQVEVSKTSTVADGTADQTSSIMSAAAKVDITEEDASLNSANDNEDDDKELE